MGLVTLLIVRLSRMCPNDSWRSYPLLFQGAYHAAGEEVLRRAKDLVTYGVASVTERRRYLAKAACSLAKKTWLPDALPLPWLPANDSLEAVNVHR